MRKARINNGIVCEILEADPFPPFHSSLLWIECEIDVQSGWIYDGLTFMAPIIPQLTQEEMAAMTEQNIKMLWQAATNYEVLQISGSAPAMVALGIVKGSTISIAVSAWIQSIWTLYYQRKPLVTYEYNPALYDFSSCGEMPYTVPEIMADLGFGS